MDVEVDRVLDIIISSNSLVFLPPRCINSAAVDAKERRTISSLLLVSLLYPLRSLLPPPPLYPSSEISVVDGGDGEVDSWARRRKFGARAWTSSIFEFSPSWVCGGT